MLCYSTLLYSTLLYSTLLYATPSYSKLLQATPSYCIKLKQKRVYSTSTALEHSKVCTLYDFGLLRYSTLLYSKLRYSTLLYATLRYSTLLYATLRYSTPSYSKLLYKAETKACVQYFHCAFQGLHSVRLWTPTIYFKKYHSYFYSHQSRDLPLVSNKEETGGMSQGYNI
jgi:hypothetical protein